tara:strand:+ start:272 stop:508 length:237 start_codon:yes stop_codon:yes gene_type:complete
MSTERQMNHFDTTSERTGNPMREFRFVRTCLGWLTVEMLRSMNGHYVRGENEADAYERLVQRLGMPGEFERYICDPSY